jgi:hypothetical protein
MVPFPPSKKKLFSGAIGRCPERTEEERDESRLGPRSKGVDERSELGLYAARPPCEAFRTMALEREGEPWIGLMLNVLQEERA